jgi:hypothetical protein
VPFPSVISGSSFNVQTPVISGGSFNVNPWMSGNSFNSQSFNPQSFISGVSGNAYIPQVNPQFLGYQTNLNGGSAVVNGVGINTTFRALDNINPTTGFNQVPIANMQSVQPVQLQPFNYVQFQNPYVQAV